MTGSFSGASASDSVVLVEDLRKELGSRPVLAGIDFEIPAGRVLALLGPNGAGKTTTVRILSTLLTPDSGRAVVAGHDVTADPEGARRSLGLSGQYAAVDENLTGFENLYLVARLYGMRRSTARRTAGELLGRFRLTEAAHRRAGTYSGGMRRRLDLAGALVARPRVVMLDEPTTGLDPRSRTDTWDIIADMVADGTSVLLTTQYLEEADRLADDIVVIDLGAVIAHGTADQLKTHVGGERLEIVVTSDANLEAAGQVLATVGTGQVHTDVRNRKAEVATSTGAQAFTRALRYLDDAGIPVSDIALRRPTLDDVFLALTGRHADRSPGDEDQDAEAIS